MLATLLLVGNLSLHPCSGASGYWCGTLTRPLDSAHRIPGTIAIGFTWLPHARSGSASQGTIVAAEGGPGYPSGASRAGYRALFGPLLQTRDLLLMDDRGTGRSEAIDCPDLQTGPMTLPAIARCGAQLGARSDLFGTDAAADDLDALLSALRIGAADFYGDSYGTFFVQVFAARHPARVRSVTLDGAYPAVGGDPWYPSTAPMLRSAFDRACRRAPVCAALGGSSLERIGRLLIRLRTPPSPIAPAELAFVMDSAGLDPLVFRDLDAAARAYLDARDAEPLRRLAREAAQYEEPPPRDPREGSNGLFVASSCSDNPQAYDMGLAPAARTAAWERALAEKRRTNADLYAPFSIDEFLAIPLDYAYVPLCQNWPVASPSHPAGQPIPAGASMPNVPALVLTGDLDTITTPAEGDAAAALFHDVRRVIVANTTHVTAVGDPYGCASGIVRNFIARRSLHAQCARTIPPLRLVPKFARFISGVPPARALAAGQRDRDLRLVAGAVDAASDALARAGALGMTEGSGLRGGAFVSSTDGERTRIGLRDVKWTEDFAVSGTATFDARTGHADAELHWNGGNLHATWPAYANAARATIAGRIDGRSIHASMPVP
ncbi:MAG TPA: alpha/beta fold hydrolase [Candidatus Tumulicola sp.]|jgi:pimeloyl-ACP methyl ester carboxylesterase